MSGKRGFSIPRRTFLRGSLYGASVAIGLPFFESVMGRGALAAPSPKRFIWLYVPNGMPMHSDTLGYAVNRWTPSGEGINYTSAANSTLKPFLDRLQRTDFTVISNLSNIGSLGPDPDGNRIGQDQAHGHGMPGMSAGRTPRRTTGSNVTVGGYSLSQQMVQSLNPPTKLKSLSLGTEENISDGGDTGTWNKIYSQTLAWQPGTGIGSSQGAIPTTKEPATLFNELFSGMTPGSGGGGGTPTTPALALAARRRSILDLVWADANSISGKLGTADKARMDEYLTNVRTLERNIAALPSPTPTATGGTCTLNLTKPGSDAMTQRQHLNHYFDMLLLAFQCDLTRIVTLAFASEGSERRYTELGSDMNYDHHQMSHYEGGGTSGLGMDACLSRLYRINLFHAEMAATFLQRLKSTDDGAGNNLLSQSIVYYNSAIGDSHAHWIGSNIPFLIAGGGGGTITHQGHVPLRSVSDEGGWSFSGTSRSAYNPVCNVHVKVLNAMGVPTTSFGDSTTVGPGLNDKLTWIRSA